MRLRLPNDLSGIKTDCGSFGKIKCCVNCTVYKEACRSGFPQAFLVLIGDALHKLNIGGAELISEKFIVADTHCDTLGYVDAGKTSIINDYNTSKKYTHLQVFAMYCAEDGESEKESFERARRYVGIYKNAVSDGKIKHCTTVTEIEQALKQNTKYISMLSIEGGECLYGSLENLHRFYENGVRMIAPVWNHNNVWASGSLSTGTADDTGLTEKGAELIELCENLGIIIDVSHSSDKTIKDIFSITKRPLCASHSNFRDVCCHNRNLTKEYVDEIVKRNGYIGLNLYYRFVKDNIEPTGDFYGLSDIIPHVRYAEENGFIDHIGFGFDIDGVCGVYPRGIDLKESIHDLFVDELLGNSVSVDATEKIAGKNFIKFLRDYKL